MTDNTINNEVTMSGAGGTLLAGRYRVVRPLGRGGMGSVWLAEDMKLDGFKVAIKMLPSVLVNNKRAYAQVKAEALVSLKLSHPNIATVRAFEEENGNPFLVMDFIDGQTLDDYLAEKGKLTEEETIRILKPVAAALDYAHAQGVVHRDVKPGNVMIRRDGVPFVLDFGIAREIQETMTRVTGKLSSGTLLYMSPEQLNGAPPKPSQDVYGFAAMAYECLRGEPPFSRGQVEFQILNKMPEPLPSRSYLAMAILRGLAKVPTARPADCRAILLPQGVQDYARRPFVPSPPATAKPVGNRTGHRVTSPVKSPAKSHGTLRGWCLPIVLIFLSIAAVLVKVDFKPPKQKVPPEELERARAEAQDKVAVCRRIDRRDGFGAKVEECEAGLDRAETEYERKRWETAWQDYQLVLKQGDALVALDADRCRACAAAERMSVRAREAKEAKADLYAREIFDDARKLVTQARSAFSEMRFGVAADRHEHAAEKFGQSLEVAKKEAERIAQTKREEEKKKAENERRKNWRQEGRPFEIADRMLALTMKWCPPGSFDMGSLKTEEGRQENEVRHHVTLSKGFWMGETEVTQGQWRNLMDGETVVDLARKALTSKFPVMDGGWKFQSDIWQCDENSDPQNFCGDVGDDIPVYHVNWNEAMAFCRRLSEVEREAGRLPDGYEYRLPTEAEWEYACRAENPQSSSTAGDPSAGGSRDVTVLDEVAWHNGNSSVGFGNRGYPMYRWNGELSLGKQVCVRAVKGKKANRWGLFDMLGNVSEWCADVPVVSKGVAEEDPPGANFGTVRSFRGGSWAGFASCCRSSRRFEIGVGYRGNCLGFRVALAPLHDGFPVADLPLTNQSRSSALQAARLYRGTLRQEADGDVQAKRRNVVIRSKTVLLPKDIPMEMIWCGPRTPNPRPDAAQGRKGFWIAKCELTQRQWKSVMRNNPSEFQSRDALPVENLSFEDCVNFIRELNAKSQMTFRLPTGEEWEYAARGGHGGDATALDETLTCWYVENSGGRTHQGGEKLANAIGLCDMIGNVWEWCDNTGCGNNVTKCELRGGSFYNAKQKGALAADGRILVEPKEFCRGAGMRLVSNEL